MPSTKCEGLSYPTHFLKSRVVLLGIIFLNTELNKLHFLRDERIFMHCSLQIKQNILLNRQFSCSCSYTIYSKSINKNRKSPFFESLLFLY